MDLWPPSLGGSAIASDFFDRQDDRKKQVFIFKHDGIIWAKLWT
jgi:hypothetical protein